MRRAIFHRNWFYTFSAAAAVATCVTLGGAACAETAAVESPVAHAEKRPWLERDRSIDERVKLLVARMTLEEKIGQMWQLSGLGPDATITGDGKAARTSLVADIGAGRVGSVLNEVDTPTINALQKVAVEESRLGIPLLIGRDVIHGFRTVFPIPLGQAASWNPDLVEQAAATAAREARSVGVAWTFAPMVDIARDPRWGRIAESPGEDPYLASALSAAMVRGFQGKDLAAPDRIAACAKHFAGYGATEGGRDYNTAAISPSTLHNVYLPPFRAAVKENVATLMTAFNELNGAPGSGNTYLLRDVLRDEWKFRGFVVSDWESIREMIVHGYCRDDKDAARTAVEAGVSMEMVSPLYHNELAKLVEKGEVSQSTIDELVAEVLRVKMRLGLFEKPYSEANPAALLSDDNLKVARQLATQSIVLLKNDARTLPLDRKKLQKIAVIGPLADDARAQLGTWSIDGRPEDCRTPLAAIKDAAGANTQVKFVSGLEDCLDRSTGQFKDATAAAREADVVLMFVGEGADLSGEAHSRAILDLPGAQNELIEAVATAGKPIVLVVEAGRPLTIGRQLEKVAAVLYAFHGGTMAGPAIADLLWGVESPSGKLPVSFPKTVGQIPLYYNHSNSGRPARPYDFGKDSHVEDTIRRDLGNNSNYMDVTPYPLFPFGYGLSYATFEYGPAKLSANKLKQGESIKVTARMKNTGSTGADEIVQLYIHEMWGKPVRPVRELKGFRRVHLDAGQSSNVEFSLSADDLAFFNNQEQPVVEPGKYEVFVGGNSLAPSAGEFEVVK
jgi:beta-glucosidase